MSLRTFSVGVILTLSGCGSTQTADPVATRAPKDRIECALGAQPAFVRQCAIERSADATTLTLYHADGGFRRLAVARDGGLSVADGSEALSGRTLTDGRLEIQVGADRYRLPTRR